VRKSINEIDKGVFELCVRTVTASEKEERKRRGMRDVQKSKRNTQQQRK